ncbi:MAG: hypothetical protein K0Q95_120 [Bacteroidota bacterium]|jgi:hypothetical protein|nr:hypothetical protein [Bacteroidota bacterium]
MKKILYLSLLFIALTIVSCNKGPGEGGKASIKGKVWIENYNTLNDPEDQYVLKSEYAGVEKDVYLIFGDDIGYGAKTKSGPDGSFEFNYLRAGSYTVYLESKDTTRTSVSGITSIKTTVDLSKKGAKDLGVIVIYN